VNIVGVVRQAIYYCRNKEVE